MLTSCEFIEAVSKYLLLYISIKTNIFLLDFSHIFAITEEIKDGGHQTFVESFLLWAREYSAKAIYVYNLIKVSQ